MRKGQVTLFIILGVLVIMMFGLYVLSLQNEKEIDTGSVTESSKDSISITNIIDTCVKDTIDEGLQILGLQGGYSVVPMMSLPTEYAFIPYYYFDGQDFSSDIDTFETEFILYIDEHLDMCINGFEAMDGVAIESNDVSSRVTINDNGLDVAFDGTVTVVTDDKEQRVNYAPYRKAMPIKNIYEIIDEIISETKINPRYINLNLMFDLMDEYNVNIETLNYGDDTVVYAITDENNKIGRYPYLFMFAIKFDNSNHAPVILTDSIKGKVGEEMDAYIEATDADDDRLTFFAEKVFVLDTTTGKVIFTPMNKGTYFVNVSVTDGKVFSDKLIEVIIK
ncbi:hypothetical protein K9M79_04465 [Candidatus Woesearchaeota archaeon]|nr:hypothetical protein [Candidatus Woesearchaeota archaeon]